MGRDVYRPFGTKNFVRDIYKPYRYQKHGEQHIYNNRYSGLFLEMGLGKTVITLTALERLINHYMEIDCVLIIAPKRVASKVWPDEIEKWEHLKSLSYIRVMGTVKQRIKALSVKRNIYIINRELVPWLVAFYGERWPFQCEVVDESSSFKNPSSERTKALKKKRPKTYRVILLTGTPTSNSLMDLWAQMYLLDMGERLGKTITYYRDNFFNVTQMVSEYVAKYEIQPGADKKIFDAIKDICISMKTRDYIDLPPRIDRVVDIEMSDKMMKMYKDFEKQKVLELLESNKTIGAVNAAALSTKLRQFASGFIYDENKKAFDVHQYKMDALEEYVDVLNGKPLIIFYWFQHSKALILKKFKKLKPLLLDSDAAIDTWNKGKSPIMLLHPASAGHGLNLQKGGCTQIWYENIWSLELIQQANARLVRPGQKFSVVSSNLKVVGTIDERIIESNLAKEKGQTALMNATKALIKKYSK